MNDLQIYQFRVVLEHVSPMVWRRILVRSNSSVADLHYTLQILMGWTDYHLHLFLIYGKEYGVYQPGGILFDDNPKMIRLSDFRLGLGEYFYYEYNFSEWWKLRIRLERVLKLQQKERIYPVCIGGSRAGPLKNSAEAWLEKLEQREPSMTQIAKLLSKILKIENFRDRDWEQLRVLRDWVKQDRFDRMAVNQRLRQYATGDDEWRWD